MTKEVKFGILIANRTYKEITIMKRGCLLAMASMAAFTISHYIPVDFIEMMLQLVGACLITLACVEITKATRK